VSLSLGGLTGCSSWSARFFKPQPVADKLWATSVHIGREWVNIGGPHVALDPQGAALCTHRSCRRPNTRASKYQPPTVRSNRRCRCVRSSVPALAYERRLEGEVDLEGVRREVNRGVRGRSSPHLIHLMH
jgi:hypothetical protein